MRRHGRQRRGAKARFEVAVMVIGFGALAASGVVMAVTGVRRAQQVVAQRPEAAVAVGDPTEPHLVRASMAQICCRQENGALTVLPAARCQSSNGESVGMELCNAVFKPVCCRRADNTPYWSTGQWCDDVGGAVDDALCQEQTRDICCEYDEGSRLPENRISWVSRDECRQGGGLERAEEQCATFLEMVCCESEGRVTETMRRDCRGSLNRREVDSKQCEPVCCHKPNAQSTLWESRANCGAKASPGATLVDDTRCEEICCQLPDKSLRRIDRRDCSAGSGDIRSIVDCGTTVEVERPDLPTDTELEPAPVGQVLPESRPPPAASPYQ